MDQTNKHDAGKTRWDLVPWAEFEEVAKVLTFAVDVKGYGEYSWQKVIPFQVRYFAALVRHIVAYIRGEVYDPESGLHHLAHATCCCLFMMWGDNNQERLENGNGI